MASEAEEWRAKRRRRREEQHSDDEDDNPFSEFDMKNGRVGGITSKRGTSSGGDEVMTAAKRLRLEREEALQLMNRKDGDNNQEVDGGVANARQRAAMSRKALAGVGGNSGGGDVQLKDEESSDKPTGDDNNDGKSPKDDTSNEKQIDEQNNKPGAASGTSLLEQAALLRKQHDSLSTTEQVSLQRRQDEDRILKEASHVQTNALQAASELAEGVKYKVSLPTGWRCPYKILKEGESEWEKIRKKWHILVEGTNCPPPIRSFTDMGYPKPIIEVLKKD